MRSDDDDIKPSSQRHILRVDMVKKPCIEAALNCALLVLLAFSLDRASFTLLVQTNRNSAVHNAKHLSVTQPC